MLGTCINRSIIVFIVSFTLMISQVGYAAEDNYDHHDYTVFLDNTTLTTSLAVAGVVTAAALVFLLSKNKSSSASLPSSKSEIEIIYRDSTPITYAFPDETYTDGVITIKNNSAQSAQLSATVQPDPEDKANIQILSSSSCNSPVAAGGICNYRFSYSSKRQLNTTPPSVTGATTLVTIKGSSNDDVGLDFPIQSFFPSYYWFLTLPYNTTKFNSIPYNYLYSVFQQENKLYIAAQYIGVAVSYDNGESWITYNESQGIGSKNLSDVYAVGDSIYVPTANGLSVSRDNGANWKTYFEGTPMTSVYVSKDNVNIYVTTEVNKLMVSRNSGDSWKEFNSTNTPIFSGITSFKGVYASEDNVKIYIATDSGLLVSLNNGASWTKYGAGTPGFGGIDTRVVYVLGNTIYVTTNNGLSVSLNDGNTWKTYTTASPGGGLGSNNIFDVYASGNAIYVATSGGLSISLDSGNTWKTYTTPDLASNTVTGVRASGSFIYATTADGLSVSSDNGENWTTYKTQGGLGGEYVNSVHTTEGKIYAGTQGITTSAGGLSVSSDNGASWFTYTTPKLGSTNVKGVYASGSNIYAATYSNPVIPEVGGLSWSKDDGATWTVFTTASTGGGLGSNNVNEVYASGNYIYAATEGGGLSKYSKTTVSWSIYKTPPLTIGFGSNNVNDVYASGIDIYAATTGGLSISTDDGGSWVTRNTSIPLGFETDVINGVYASGSGSSAIIYAATEKGLLVSYNGGSSWPSKYKQGTTPGFLGDATKRVYASGSDSTTSIYVGTNNGLAVSKNNGATWNTYKGGLLVSYLTVFGLSVSGNTIYIATYLGGLNYTKEPPTS